MKRLVSLTFLLLLVNLLTTTNAQTGFAIIDSARVNAVSLSVSDTGYAGTGYRVQLSTTYDLPTPGLTAYAMIGKTYSEMPLPEKVFITMKAPSWAVGVLRIAVALDNGNSNDTAAVSHFNYVYSGSNWKSYSFQLAGGGLLKANATEINELKSLFGSEPGRTNSAKTFKRLRIAFSFMNGESGTRVVFLDNIEVFSGNTSTLLDPCNPEGVVTIPPIPTLGIPLNGAINVPLENTTLKWDASQGATHYNVEISQGGNTGFMQNVTNTSVLLTNLQCGLTYSWKVQAVNTAGSSNWSETRSFKTVECLTIPSVPKLSSPANNSTSVSINPTLIWNASDNASTYRLQVLFQGTTVIFDNSVTTNSYTVTGLLNNTTYYWRVSATNTSGTSDWSETWSFKTEANIVIPGVPELVSPTNGQSGVSVNPLLDWNLVSSATQYRIQLLLVNGVAVFDQAVDAPINAYQAYGLAKNTTYYWRVSAINSVGQGDWSQSWYFTTESDVVPIPQPPVLAPLTDNVPLNVTLAWGVSEGATSYDVVLKVGGNAVFMQTVNTTSVAVTLNCSTAYEWSVRASNSSGSSSWSIANFTTVECLPIDVPVLISPQNNSTGASTNQELSWNAVQYADKYDIEVGTSSTNLYQKLTSNTTSIELQNLSYATTYYWRVRGVNGLNYGPWSEVRNFMTTAITGVDNENTEKVFSLKQNYPNPFNPTTVVRYGIPSSAMVILKVYDMLGSEVATLVNEEKPAGRYEVEFNASNLPSGTYFYRLQAGSFVESKKMTFTK